MLFTSFLFSQERAVPVSPPTWAPAPITLPPKLRKMWLPAKVKHMVPIMSHNACLTLIRLPSPSLYLSHSLSLYETLSILENLYAPRITCKFKTNSTSPSKIPCGPFVLWASEAEKSPGQVHIWILAARLLCVWLFLLEVLLKLGKHHHNVFLHGRPPCCTIKTANKKESKSAYLGVNFPWLSFA